MKVSSVSVIAAVCLEQKAVLSVSEFLRVTADEMFGNSIFAVGSAKSFPSFLLSLALSPKTEGTRSTSGI